VAERARRSSPWLALAGLVGAVCAAAYALTLAPGVTWANHGLDSGELIAAAITGGIPHPTGYPAYVLLARVALLLPALDPAVVVTLLSPLAAIVAALALGDAVRRCSPADEPWRSAAGALAALALALSPLFWSQAVIAEVYAPSAACIALLLRGTLGRQARHEDGGTGGEADKRAVRLMPGGVLAGAACGFHVLVLPFVAAWAASVVWAGDAAGRGRRLFGVGVGIALGLLVYLYVPLAAASRPPISWGDAASWDGFWWLVSGRLYAGMAFGLPLEQLGPRLLAWGALAAQQFGWFGLPLALLGLLRGGLSWPQRLITLGLALFVALFALGYNSVDAQVYLIPALLVCALWLGLGAGLLLQALARAVRLRDAAHRPLALPLLGALVLAGAVFWQTPHVAATVDASDDRRALVYAATVLREAPADAVLLADDDRSAFPLWYALLARGERPDLRLVTEPLLGFSWYRASLRHTYPDLALPEAALEGWEPALATRLGRPVCRAQPEPPRVVCR
jgi:hypothetical protein